MVSGLAPRSTAYAIEKQGPTAGSPFSCASQIIDSKTALTEKNAGKRKPFHVILKNCGFNQSSDDPQIEPSLKH